MFSKILMKDGELRMYGQTEEEIISAFRDSQFEGLDSSHIYIMGILSDAQEVMSHGNLERANQFINKAKFLIHYTNKR